MQRCQTNKPISVIVLCSPGVMRESLRALFSAISGVQVRGMMDLTEATANTLLEQRPDCVVVESPDACWDAAALALLNGLKQAGLRTRSLIIAASPNQGSECLAAGADFVLMKGFVLGELKQAFDILFGGNPSADYP